MREEHPSIARSGCDACSMTREERGGIQREAGSDEVPIFEVAA
jgi:hypothetical protein